MKRIKTDEQQASGSLKEMKPLCFYPVICRIDLTRARACGLDSRRSLDLLGAGCLYQPVDRARVRLSDCGRLFGGDEPGPFRTDCAPGREARPPVYQNDSVRLGNDLCPYSQLESLLRRSCSRSAHRLIISVLSVLKSSRDHKKLNSAGRRDDNREAARKSLSASKKLLKEF